GAAGAPQPRDPRGGGAPHDTPGAGWPGRDRRAPEADLRRGGAGRGARRARQPRPRHSARAAVRLRAAAPRAQRRGGGLGDWQRVLRRLPRVDPAAGHPGAALVHDGDDALRELRALPLLAGVSGAVTVYTDGACSGNPGPGGWAAIIVDHG